MPDQMRVRPRQHPSHHTILTALSACGPSGTGCTCPKGKCNCSPCVNAAHSSKVPPFPYPHRTRVELTRTYSVTAAGQVKTACAPNKARLALVNQSRNY